MEISADERLLLIKKKEEIAELTAEIFRIYRQPENADELKGKIHKILSNIATISSYSRSKHAGASTNILIRSASMIDRYIEKDVAWWNIVIHEVNQFCVAANGIRFDFTKSGLSIHLPKIEISPFKTEM